MLRTNTNEALYTACTVQCVVVDLGLQHRIIDDRIEKSKKGRRIGHSAFAESIFKVQRLRQY